MLDLLVQLASSLLESHLCNTLGDDDDKKDQIMNLNNEKSKAISAILANSHFS